MTKFFSLQHIAVVVALALGAILGLGIYTFIYAKGASYLTNDPGACVNCHIMRDQYNGWLKSSHHAVAACNDCHAPKNFIGKYTTKAVNGFWHSFAFTTGRFPEKIRINKRNLEITETRCRECHDVFSDSIDKTPSPDGRFCTRCHLGVGHDTQ